jgi:excisionase family DNA binding protein
LKLPDFLAAILRVFLFLFHFSHVRPKEAEKMETTSRENATVEFYTPEELAALLRIPIRTLEKWTQQRRLPVVKVGRLNRFPRVEIQKRLLNGNLLR